MTTTLERTDRQSRRPLEPSRQPCRASRITGRLPLRRSLASLTERAAWGWCTGPSVLLDLFVAGSLVAAARGALTRPVSCPVARLLRPLVALGVAAPVVYLLAIRPWLRRWGATPEGDAEAATR